MPDDYDGASAREPHGSPEAPDAPAVPPTTVRAAGALVTLEGLVGVGIAVYYVASALAGNHEKGISYYGTAAWFAVLFGAVLAAGVTLTLGRRGGRGIGIITQVLLAPVAFSLLGQSHQIVWGVLLALVIVPAFVLLVHPRTSEWMNRPYERAARRSRADGDEAADEDEDDEQD